MRVKPPVEPERIGTAFRYRMDNVGVIYERRGRQGFRRTQFSPNDVRAVGVAPNHIFLSAGGGFFLYVHVCVIRVTCPMCKAETGQLCRNNGTEACFTHYVRRAAYQAWRRAQKGPAR